MNFFKDLFSNHLLICCVLSWFIAQFTKGIIFFIRAKSLDITRFLGAGGMPSSHSSLVATLTTFIALTEGAATPVFGLALIFAFVTIYDACGVRYAAGQQAKILNQILLNLATDDPKVRDARLKEFLGHTKVEVIAGCILGIFIALAYYALFIR